MITRRSALIVFAGADLSGSVNAQDQVTDGLPRGSLAFKITRLPVEPDADDLALMALYGDKYDQTKFAIELQSESHGRFAMSQSGRDSRDSFPTWAKPWEGAVLALQTPNRTR